MPQTSKILNMILAESQQKLSKNIGVRAYFDLDSTLFDVTPRVQRILEDYCKDSSSRLKFPEAIKKLSQVRLESHPYYIKDLMYTIGLTDQPSEFYKDIFNYWKTRFFQNEYLTHDVPEKGAVDYVHELHQMGAEIIYLTGRDIPRMGPGTLQSLKRWNFPIEKKRTKLVLKPHHEMEDAPFKVSEFKKDNPKNKILFFENEPVNIHLAQQETPFVDIVYFDSVHSGKAPEPTDVLTISHFVHK